MKRICTFFMVILAFTIFCSAKFDNTAPVKRIRQMNINQAVRLVQQERGNVVLFHIFATWCGPCMREFPVLDEIARQYKRKGVSFIILSKDDDIKAVEDFVSGLNLNFEVIHISPNNKSEMAAAVKTIGGNYEGPIPYSLVFNRNGKPVYQWTGGKSFESYQEIFEKLQ